MTVKGAEPCLGTLEVPQTLGGHPVSIIGAAAFSDCENLTEIVIPEGVADIGAAAFCDCSGLTSITIVDGKVTISYTPELDDARKAMRKYTTWGKKSLMDANWTEVPQGHETEYNFFKVSVEMR